MSREIKFSYIYQHGETGQWTDVTRTLENIEGGINALVSVWLLVARRQWTGLVDKAGKDIFSGDIMQHFAFPEGQLFEVEWDDHGGSWSGHGSFHEWSESKIVGNRWEHPDLLQQTEEK